MPTIDPANIPTFAKTAGSESESGSELELTVLMPCLNESATVGTCVRKAMEAMRRNGIHGEVVVADNGSTDGSQQIAADEGARSPAGFETCRNGIVRGLPELFLVGERRHKGLQ